jgi:hypothetical protein
MVRIIRQPWGIIDGISLDHYRVGFAYELYPPLADFLVLEGYAVVEMRREQRSQRRRFNERRAHT